MFSVHVRPVERAVVVQLRGELDFESVVQLHEAAEAATAAQPGPELVVVDCTVLSFCDSSGIGSFIRLHQRVSANGGRLRLAAAPAPLARVLSLTGLDAVIAVHPDAEDALAVPLSGHNRAAAGHAEVNVQERRVG
ncbi:STAS domain-containing protein [Streptomyces pratensis]|uniref:STAS domain-containing protein n=1 Tax=Streptomyces pratensis TaxID=1169025 RepID=UPI0037A5DAF6